MVPLLVDLMADQLDIQMVELMAAQMDERKVELRVGLKVASKVCCSVDR